MPREDAVDDIVVPTDSFEPAMWCSPSTLEAAVEDAGDGDDDRAGKEGEEEEE